MKKKLTEYDEWIQNFPRICIIHGIPMKAFHFEFVEHVFLDYGCEKCQAEFEKLKNNLRMFSL